MYEHSQWYVNFFPFLKTFGAYIVHLIAEWSGSGLYYTLLLRKFLCFGGEILMDAYLQNLHCHTSGVPPCAEVGKVTVHGADLPST